MNTAVTPDINLTAGQSRPRPDWAPAQYLFMARGFTCIFWGLLVMLILLLGNAGIECFPVSAGAAGAEGFLHLRLPAYVVGVIVMAWGVRRLRETPGRDPVWEGRRQTLMALLALAIYFAPFIEWWRTWPRQTYLMVNMLGMLFTGTLMLFYINLLAAEVGRRLHRAGVAWEAQIYATAVVVLMMAPLAAAILFSMLAAVRYDTPFGLELVQTLRRVPLWIYALASIPASLTLIAAWKARDLCCQRLRQAPSAPVNSDSQNPDEFTAERQMHDADRQPQPME